MSSAWGYSCAFGLRTGQPPAETPHEVIERLGPEHMGQGHAVQFLTGAGQLDSGTVTDWGATGATVRVERPSSFAKAHANPAVLTFKVAYAAIRTVTPATTALAKSLAASHAGGGRRAELGPGDDVVITKRGGDRLQAIVRTVSPAGIHWAVGLANQGLWFYLIVWKQQLWGLAPLTALLTWRYTVALIRWRREGAR